MTKGRQHMKLNLRREFRGRELDPEDGRRIVAEAVAGHRATAILARLTGEETPDTPDAEWLRRIMAAVEARIVEALWTLALTPGDRGPGWPSRHGPDYTQDFRDVFANAVAAGGKWEQPQVRPPKPSSKAIDAMHEPLGWLMPREVGGVLENLARNLVLVAAATKRGETGRNVAWARVVAAMPELTAWSVSTLRRRYEAGLREIVAELVRRG